MPGTSSAPETAEDRPLELALQVDLRLVPNWSPEQIRDDLEQHVNEKGRPSCSAERVREAESRVDVELVDSVDGQR